jgi:hypothetical protein
MGRDNAPEGICECIIDSACVCEPIQCARLIKAVHFHRPFNWLAFAVKRKPSIWLARDRHEPTIELGRKPLVNLELRRASRLAFRERRIIKKWKANCSLDLQRPVSDQEHRGCVGIEAADFAYQMIGGILQER